RPAPRLRAERPEERRRHRALQVLRSDAPLLEQVAKCLDVERGRLGAVQQELRGGALFSMERKDPLLHGALRNETIDGHWPCLTNAVSAVGGLGLDGWVPPRIEVNDVVGGRQVEP